MKRQSAMVFLLLAGIAIGGQCVAQQAPAEAPAMGFAEQQGDANEKALYDAGTAAMNESKWTAALDDFSQVAKLNGRRADGALYWKAYAQNKLGQRVAALETIGALRKQFPRSTWLRDAGALEIEIRGASGGSVAPQSENDEELKMLAVQSLMNNDPQRAIPILQKVLTGNQPIKVKERALFVLAQDGSPEAQKIIEQVARGQAQPELQRKAINQLGVAGNRKLLGEIYSSSTNPEAKKSVLNALGICGGSQELFAIARSEKDPELRNAAINGLAVAGAQNELRQLYSEATDPEAKRRLIRSAIVSGDTQLVINAAQSDRDPEVKREAIRTLGVTGGANVSSTLLNIYNSDKNPEIREAVLQGLFVHGDAHSMVELAKKETDPEMKKRIVQKLSVMGDKEATDYLMQLLEK